MVTKLFIILGLLVLTFSLIIASDQKDAKDDRMRVKIASLSFVPVKWDKESNLNTIEKMAREAAAGGAKILVTSEGAVEGYLINEVLKEENKGLNLEKKFLEISEPLEGPSVSRVASLSRELNVDIILGILERKNDILFNSVIWLDSKGEILHTHHKTHMAQPYYQPAFYHPGDRIQAFDTKYGRFGMMICFERQIPEVARALALDGARVLFNPSYGSRGEWNNTILRARARDNNAPVIFTHPLQTLAINRKGEVILNRDDEEGISYFEIEIEPQNSNKFHQRRPEVFIDKLSTNPEFED